MKWSCTSVVTLPIALSPVLMMKKNKTNSTVGHPEKCLNSAPQNCYGHQKQGGLRGPVETGQLDVMWSPRWDLGQISGRN
jgi:hypothetical protein